MSTYNTGSAADTQPGLFQAVPADSARIKTLADLLSHLMTDPSRDRRHIEMMSALRKMGEALRRSLNDIPADPAKLKALIATASPAVVGMTKQRWSRIRSLTLASLRVVGIDMMPGRDIGGSSSAWKALTATLPTRAARLGLSRFMSYCTREAIEPNEVTVTTFDAFRTALETKSLCTSSDAIYRGAARRWNQAAKTLPSWPQVQIPLETHPHFYSLDWDQFPSSFAADVEAFLTKCGNACELDELDDDFIRPVKPSTVEVRRRQLRQLASLLVLSGFPIDQITDLTTLVEPHNAKAALRTQKERQGAHTTQFLAAQAWLLAAVARHWVRAPEQAATLSDLASRLNVKPKGMTQRNRDRLRQFDLKANLDAILSLPAKTIAQVKKEATGSPQDARRVMLAVAVELLIVAPMRVNNLAGLEPERHLVDIGRGLKHNRHIIIPAQETKTGVEFEMMLPPDTAALLDLYMKTYRPRLCAESSPYLFPASDGGRRSTIAFSKAVSVFIKKETGIRMHVHLFRHLAGKLYLDANPSDMETVRRFLGHTTMATTARYYTEQRTSQGFKQYDRTIAQLRGVASGQLKSSSISNSRDAQ